MSGRLARRGMLLGSCLAAVVGAAAPGTAYAAGAANIPPTVKNLQTEGRDCLTDAEPMYLRQRPTLSAEFTDPDANGSGTAEFEIWWTDTDGAEQRRTLSAQWPLNGRRGLPVNFDLPADTVISWRVRANDGIANSEWSPAGPGAACRFVYDDQAPETPVVTSSDFPEETYWGAGVGIYGSFTVDSPSPDVVEYRYTFNGGSSGSVRPAEMGGPATIRYVPLSSGTKVLAVSALDRAGQQSAPRNYTFIPKSASAPVSQWKLADPAGSTTAAAETGQAARAGSGVTFGASAPAGTPLTATATLDGSDHGYLTTDTPAVDSGRTFGVGAWVRPAETGRSMTVLSQDTATGSAYSLGLDSAADGSAAWSFALGDAKVSGGTPKAGKWSYVLGVYDTETGKAQLFVDGWETGTKAEAAPVAADGAFQIGRLQGKDGYQQRWHGEIGDVRAYDRLVVPDEVTSLAQRKSKELGHWSFVTSEDGTTPERNGGAPLRLATGATVHGIPGNGCSDCAWPLEGDGDLKLDGERGYAVLDKPVVDTSDSFTLGVVAWIDPDDATRPMTVLSQAGEHTDAFKLRYDPKAYAWQLVMPVRDEVGAPETVVSQITSPDGASGHGTKLAVVYDDAAGTVTLYIDGYTNAGGTARVAQGWTSNGPLQVGRARTADGTDGADGWGEYLKGHVDELQAYSGALTEHEIRFLGSEW
ncbi:LamG domain-containing protein [Streptomyces sp. NPDC048718]|uniref:LamG domain-containing protein n=1 Tax=Streptomyces sp. NPDC048718 TaxID=3365587 RepID=UPI00371CBA7D